ncbi:MAG: hypothetical protein NUW37_08565 [Planctomycetes bacterium]|nr:hypothetical protein [Planctomycetota bacterium]
MARLLIRWGFRCSARTQRTERIYRSCSARRTATSGNKNDNAATNKTIATDKDNKPRTTYAGIMLGYSVSSGSSDALGIPDVIGIGPTNGALFDFGFNLNVIASESDEFRGKEFVSNYVKSGVTCALNLIPAVRYSGAGALRAWDFGVTPWAGFSLANVAARAKPADAVKKSNPLAGDTRLLMTGIEWSFGVNFIASDGDSYAVSPYFFMTFFHGLSTAIDYAGGLDERPSGISREPVRAFGVDMILAPGDSANVGVTFGMGAQRLQSVKRGVFNHNAENAFFFTFGLQIVFGGDTEKSMAYDYDR